MSHSPRDCRTDPCAGSHLHDNQPPELKPFDIGAAIDLMITNCHDARWDVVSRAMRVLEDAFTKNEAATA